MTSVAELVTSIQSKTEEYYRRVLNLMSQFPIYIELCKDIVKFLLKTNTLKVYLTKFYDIPHMKIHKSRMSVWMFLCETVK